MINSVDDVLRNPSLLSGKTPQDIAKVIEKAKEAGWRVETLGRGSHKGQGLILREVKDGKLTSRMIQWHPGGGHHGPNPYWKVSSPESGITKIGP